MALEITVIPPYTNISTKKQILQDVLNGTWDENMENLTWVWEDKEYVSYATCFMNTDVDPEALTIVKDINNHFLLMFNSSRLDTSSATSNLFALRNTTDPQRPKLLNLNGTGRRAYQDLLCLFTPFTKILFDSSSSTSTPVESYMNVGIRGVDDETLGNYNAPPLLYQAFDYLGYPIEKLYICANHIYGANSVGTYFKKDGKKYTCLGYVFFYEEDI